MRGQGDDILFEHPKRRVIDADECQTPSALAQRISDRGPGLNLGIGGYGILEIKHDRVGPRSLGLVKQFGSTSGDQEPAARNMERVHLAADLAHPRFMRSNSQCWH